MHTDRTYVLSSEHVKHPHAFLLQNVLQENRSEGTSCDPYR